VEDRFVAATRDRRDAMSAPEPRRQWRVRRRWLPWRRRIREVPDAPMLDVPADDTGIGAIFFVIALILSIPALVVLALVVFELLALVLLLPLVVLARIVLPVPWRLEVSSRSEGRRIGGWVLEREVPVAGWRASSARIHELREQLAGTGLT
jgi:hypothetical protein